MKKVYVEGKMSSSDEVREFQAPSGQKQKNIEVKTHLVPVNPGPINTGSKSLISIL